MGSGIPVGLRVAHCERRIGAAVPVTPHRRKNAWKPSQGPVPSLILQGGGGGHLAGQMRRGIVGHMPARETKQAAACRIEGQPALHPYSNQGKRPGQTQEVPALPRRDTRSRTRGGHTIRARQVHHRESHAQRRLQKFCTCITQFKKDKIQTRRVSRNVLCCHCDAWPNSDMAKLAGTFG